MKSLYNDGKFLMEQLKLSITSKVLYSDYCEDPILFSTYPESVKFTKDVLLFCERSRNVEEADDWLEWDRVEVCPWNNIIEINHSDKKIKKEELDTWLLQQEDHVMELPFCNARRGNITVIMKGRPYSERNRPKKKETIKTIKSFSSQIKKILPNPITGKQQIPIEVFIDVFSRQKGNFPDTDRLVPPILDAFQGLVYENDRQVKKHQPRVINTSKVFERLECRTIPMGSFEIDNITTGALFPLAKGCTDYFVIRVLY